MRPAIAIVFGVIMIALAWCAAVARRSENPLGVDVSNLLLALIPPMCGNLIIVLSESASVSVVGCYVYYIGMDVTMFALVSFAMVYCSMGNDKPYLRRAVAAVLAADMVQLLLNTVFGHAFGTTQVLVDGMPYHQLVPYMGQTVHRVVDYGLFAAVILIFVVKTIRAPKIYVERYATVLLGMIIVGIWESFYVFSSSPIDRSMIGFGAFGILVYYLALYYRPVRLIDSMLVSLVSKMDEAMFCFDGEGACVYANDKGMDLMGVNAEAIASVPSRLEERFGRLPLESAGSWSSRSAFRSGAQTQFYALEYLPLLDKKQHLVGSSLSVRDRTEEELDIRREMYRARHDFLTDLYNRDYLFQQIAQTIVGNPETQYLVTALDVKDFKLINDLYSSEFGDGVLKEIANMMRRNCPEGSVYGRLTADKFGALVPCSKFSDERVERLLSGFEVQNDSGGFAVVLHMGVYDIENRDLNVAVMFDRAFMALDTVKGGLARRVAHYDNKMRDQVVWNQTISRQLDGAIASGQIRPFLQPMVNEDGRVVGAEVLVRWIHPKEGFLPPGRFVPVFEDNGMIVRVDQHMWRCACEILAGWRHRGVDLFLSVNISPKDFYYLDIFEEFVNLIETYKIDPKRLRLEITETVMMSDLDYRLTVIEALRSQGFIVEMDDFGSGYSSLNMLKDIPVDVLKIDMKFLYQTKDEQRAQTILRNIFNLSSDLGIHSLTEGVETPEQFDMLAQMGCELYQGYYFAKPMSENDFEAAYVRDAL